MCLTEEVLRRKHSEFVAGAEQQTTNPVIEKLMESLGLMVSKRKTKKSIKVLVFLGR